jgi:chromosome segregation ATPase
MSSWDNEYWDVVKELDKTQRKLRKADHDRQRYARRIRFLQAQQQFLSREYNAMRLERDILKTTLESCERRLLYDAGRATEAGTGTEECRQAGSSGSGPEV